jgi:signal peptidase I
MPTRTRTVVVINRCQCSHCGDQIESKHRHHIVSCSCGTIFTDGGTDYIRRGFKKPGDIIDLSETYEEQYESEW